MAPVAALIGSLLLAYLIGSFPTSYLFARTIKGIDIRKVGSGNAGATNVLRSVGKVPALVTLAIDILKGWMVVTIIANYFYTYDIDLLYDAYRGLMGITVVCGHIWPVFLKFRGGKGVATTLGVAIGLTPFALIPSALIWFLVFYITNFVSLASIMALILFPAVACILKYPFYIILSSVAICSLSIYKHRDNIRRLVRGEESKT
ncbi:MAG: glycerol-3-phosphate 1-O-acyltransferase PlsY, partial [Candidatus Omnitrophica bacterium]|nr:glycerol-3-phosphate 1-O-acyltransferase PlsY [Candidatus Omnitrophota bacterium]